MNNKHRLSEETHNETKLKALEEKRPDEMEMAEKAHEERKKKKNEEVNPLVLMLDSVLFF